MRKRYLFSILLLVGVASTGSAAAQAVDPQIANQCAFISSTNYDRCCNVSRTFNDPSLSGRCDDYVQRTICANTPTDPRCQAVNGPTGGTQSTGALNSGSGFSTQGNPGNGPSYQGGPAFAPQQNNELAACSAIKLKSALEILVWLKCVIVAALIPLIFSLAFLVFLWGVFKFIRASDPKAKQEGQQFIWWGMLGLFIMVSLWGIIKIVGTTLGIESTVPLLQTEYLR